MSVSILYYKVTPEKISSAQLSEQIDAWMEEIPEQKQQKLRKLRQQSDLFLSLAGLQLLKIGMSQFSDKPFVLKDVTFPDKGKPVYSGSIDFNISHSGDMACCVISDSVKVGIDIELCRNVYPATMNKYLAVAKKTGKDKQQEFFTLWTKLEAIIKAAGTGSIHSMSDINIDNQGGLYQNHFWYCYPVDIISGSNDKNYTCHIACSDSISSIDVKQIHEF